MSQYTFRHKAGQLEKLHYQLHRQKKEDCEKTEQSTLIEDQLQNSSSFQRNDVMAKTHDLLHVKELLGYKNVQNTLIYIHLEAAIFKNVNDEFHVKVAKSVQEAKKLLEVGL